MRRIHILGALTLFLAATVLPLTALGGEIVRTSGESASAEFSVPDPSNPNCIFLWTYVWAQQGTNLDSGLLVGANQGTNQDPTAVFGRH